MCEAGGCGARAVCDTLHRGGRTHDNRGHALREPDGETDGDTDDDTSNALCQAGRKWDARRSVWSITARRVTVNDYEGQRWAARRARDDQSPAFTASAGSDWKVAPAFS